MKSITASEFARLYPVTAPILLWDIGDKVKVTDLTTEQLACTGEIVEMHEDRCSVRCDGEGLNVIVDDIPYAALRLIKAINP